MWNYYFSECVSTINDSHLGIDVYEKKKSGNNLLIMSDNKFANKFKRNLEKNRPDKTPILLFKNIKNTTSTIIKKKWK